jgi:hypothetical protein
MDLIEELKKLISQLERNEIDYALCGGLALAIYAKPRATLDIEIMIDPDFLEKAKMAVSELGFELSAAPMKLHDGAIIIHRLVKIDEISGEHLVLDFLLVTSKTKEAWENKITVEWEGNPLKVVSPNGLILFKSFRKSGQDKDDIEYLRSLVIED